MKYILLISILLPFVSLSQTKEILLQTAEDSLYNGNPEYAIEILNNFIKTDSTNADAYYLLAETKPSSGFKEVDKALSLDSMHVKSLELRGHYYYFGHQTELALRDYERAYAISGECNPLIMIAQIKTDLGDYEGAFLDYDKMLNIESEGCISVAHMGLARVHFLLGDYEYAISEFEKFNINSTINPELYFILAESYHKIGKDAEACETIHEFDNFWSSTFDKEDGVNWVFNEIERLIKDCCK